MSETELGGKPRAVAELGREMPQVHQELLSWELLRLCWEAAPEPGRLGMDQSATKAWNAVLCLWQSGPKYFPTLTSHICLEFFLKSSFFQKQTKGFCEVQNE